MGFMRDVLYQDPNWDPLTANLESTVATADEKMAKILNSTDPDLAPFARHGGKLIIYHGWSDAAIPPLNAVHYYSTVIEKDQKADSYVKLYMVPAMQHCALGPGPNLFGQVGVLKPGDATQDIFTALADWVESGVEPKEIVATKYTDDDPGKSAAMTRPVCPYPQVAKYKGSGDSKDAASYTCAAE
jgi:feruloyl esterase